MSDENKLKTLPKGFDKENKHIELLKLKSFVVYHEISDSKLKSKDFEKTIINGFKAMHPFLEFLREAGAN